MSTIYLKLTVPDEKTIEQLSRAYGNDVSKTVLTIIHNYFTSHGIEGFAAKEINPLVEAVLGKVNSRAELLKTGISPARALEIAKELIKNDCVWAMLNDAINIELLRTLGFEGLLKITGKYGIDFKTYSDGYTAESAVNMCNCLREIMSAYGLAADVAVLWAYIDDLGPGGDSETITIVKHPGTGELLYSPINNFLCCGESEEDWRVQQPRLALETTVINNFLKNPDQNPVQYGLTKLLGIEYVPKYVNAYNLTLIPRKA